MIQPTPQTGSHSNEQQWQALHNKLITHATSLRQQGSLVSRRLPDGRSRWQLRFKIRKTDGSIKQAALYVGDDPDVVRRTLDELRAPDRWLDEIELLSRFGSAVWNMVQFGRGPGDSTSVQ